MNNYVAIGLLIVLTTICIGVLFTWFYAAKAGGQTTVMTHIAALQGLRKEES